MITTCRLSTRIERLTWLPSAKPLGAAVRGRQYASYRPHRPDRRHAAGRGRSTLGEALTRFRTG